jgi:SAM-dependent methyltransferase
MSFVSRILRNPLVWTVCQNIFSSDREKMTAYRSVIKRPGRRILDFGCANGNTFPAFKDFDYYGVDLDETFIRYAQRKYASFPNAHFIHANILSGPFQPRFFDHILFACTGHHLDDETFTRILIAMMPMLNEEGAIHFIDPIRVPEKDGFILRMIIGADQGKFHRTSDAYRRLFGGLSKHLQVAQFEFWPGKAGLIPQPAGIYMPSSGRSQPLNAFLRMPGSES